MTPLPDQLCVVDFETAGIEDHPNYPPKPCGVSIRWENGKSEYLAWGHASDNNVSFEEARRAVVRAYRFPCAFHNGAFDMEVARVHMDLPYPREWHDTMIMTYLCDPHAPSLSLKPLGQYLLGIKPDEKDALLEYGMSMGLRKSEVMANIPKLPGTTVVGPYANQDTKLTHKVAEWAWDKIDYHNLWEAYQRERALLPWLVDSESRGVRVDRPLLEFWRAKLEFGLGESDHRLHKSLGEGVNLDSNDEMADALERAGLVKPGDWTLTATGVRSVALPALAKLLPPSLFSLIRYRTKSATMLRTFVVPWLARSLDGRLHTRWSQVRNPEGNGTRTGRIASFEPNLANIPKDQKVAAPDGLPDLPLLRQALLPEHGHVWMSADYSQQELRLLAHYEDGDLMRAYQANPRLDLHLYASELVLRRTGIVMERDQAKILGFSIIYGAGVLKIAEQLGIEPAEAEEFRRAYLSALPGVAAMRDEATGRFRRRMSIRTLGGRVYYAEPPKRGRSFEYKGLNVLIQGSAADQTKQAIIDFCTRAADIDVWLLGQVYDEINVSVPKGLEREAAKRLNYMMVNAFELDVPVTTDIETGPNWADLTKMEIPT